MSRPSRARELKRLPGTLCGVSLQSRPSRARELKPSFNIGGFQIERRAPHGRVN